MLTAARCGWYHNINNVSSSGSSVSSPSWYRRGSTLSTTYCPPGSVDAAKKPVNVYLEAGKTYSYCTCGLSKTQPFCDGTDKIFGYSMLRPIEFTVEEPGNYCMCMCKASKQRPLCDGSHKFIDQTPRDKDATQFFAVANDTEVYEGVAQKLGYKTKKGGFQ